MKSNSLKVAACSLLVASAAPAEAATQYFLEFSGIKGDATSKEFKDAIAIESFSWGIEFEPPAAPGGKSIIDGTDFEWTQGLDTSVPQLLEKLGTTLETAELHGVKLDDGKAFEFFTLKFSDVFLSSLSMSASSGEPPSVDGAFSYGLLEMTVTPQKLDGTAGVAVKGTFSPTGFSGSTKVFAQIASFGEPLLDTTPVPLPASLPFLLGGIAGLVMRHARRTSQPDDAPAGTG